MTSPSNPLATDGVTHDCRLVDAEGFIQAMCSCGWKGTKCDRQSDDWAFTRAHNEKTSHKRGYPEWP